MRRLIVASLFAAALFWMVLGGSRIAHGQNSDAIISITTVEKGLPVFVDGIKIGVTPLENYSLPAGYHEIAVKQTFSESWLDSDWVEKYQLAAGDTLDLHPHFKRGYMINSKPYGAEVFLNNGYQGTTPVVVYLTGGQRHEVELRLSGYESSFFSIDSTSQRLWSITLLEDKDRVSEQEMGAVTTNSRRAHFRRLATIAASVSAATGITAILLKRRADHYYEDYLSTGDPRELESLYNKTNQYDEYAGTAFIVFQVSFGLSFYWFLRSTSE